MVDLGNGKYVHASDGFVVFFEKPEKFGKGYTIKMILTTDECDNFTAWLREQKAKGE